MSTVVIGMFLLACIATGSVYGWHARFNVLSAEAKEQSARLALGCARRAIVQLSTDRNYVGNATTSESISGQSAECFTHPISQSTLPGGDTKVVVRIRACVRDAYTNIEYTARLKNIAVMSTRDLSAHSALIPGVSTESWTERVD